MSTSVKILLTSPSLIKKNAVKEFFTNNVNINLTSINCTECHLPDQPIINININNDNGICFAKERMNFASKTYNFVDFDFVISIESGISIKSNSDDSSSNNLNNNIRDYICNDVCYVLIYSKYLKLLSVGLSFGIPLDSKYIIKLQNDYQLIHYNNKISGYNMTAGELMAKENKKINSKNWMKYTANIDRIDQIKNALETAYNEYKINSTNKLKLINIIKSNNIITYDLLKNELLLDEFINLIVVKYKYDVIDVVISLESNNLNIGPIGIIIAQKIKSEYKHALNNKLDKINFSDKNILIIDNAINTNDNLLNHFVKESNCNLKEYINLNKLFNELIN